jgi:hypothetical protein
VFIYRKKGFRDMAATGTGTAGLDALTAEAAEQDPTMIALTEMFGNFDTAWKEYERIGTTWANTSRDALKGRVWVAMYPGKVDFVGEFHRAGVKLAEEFKRLQRLEKGFPRRFVWPCLEALTCFVKFLNWDKSTQFTFKGADDSLRDIYHNRNFKFKQQWTQVLRSMVSWVRLAYKDEAEWVHYLKSQPFDNWPDILRKLVELN